MPRQRVLDSRGHLREHLARNNVVALQFSQLLREHLFCWPRKKLLQFTEPPGFALQVIQDRRLPLSSDDLSRDDHGTIEGIHIGYLLIPGYRKVPTSNKETLA